MRISTKNRDKPLEQTIFRPPTSTGFSLSHSLSRSVVLFSTTLFLVTTFIWRLATCAWTDASLLLMISQNAPHSTSTISLYTQVVGNWNRWHSRILWPSLNVSTYSNNTSHEIQHTPSNNASDNTQQQCQVQFSKNSCQILTKQSHSKTVNADEEKFNCE